MDYVPFWALLIFMLNYIPTIGSMVAVLLPTTLALVQSYLERDYSTRLRREALSNVSRAQFAHCLDKET